MRRVEGGGLVVPGKLRGVLAGALTEHQQI
jgi:hypothetical protein